MASGWICERVLGVRGTERVFSTNANELAPDEREREKERRREFKIIIVYWNLSFRHTVSHMDFKLCFSVCIFRALTSYSAGSIRTQRSCTFIYSLWWKKEENKCFNTEERLEYISLDGLLVLDLLYETNRWYDWFYFQIDKAKKVCVLFLLFRCVFFSLYIFT